MNAFSALSFRDIPIGRPLLLILFALAIFLFLGASAVLLFHWKRYGEGARFIALGEGVYFTVAAALILAALSFLSAF